MNASESPGAEPSRSSDPAPAGPRVLPPKRIYRDPKGPIGGVASGFAGYFDVDPVIPRLLWVVALLSGIGFPAYLLCWVVIPKAQTWPPPGYHGRPAAADGAEGNGGLLSGLVIVALAAVVGAGVDGVGEYILPAVLVGFGVYLLNQRGAGSDAAAAADVPPGGADPSDASSPGAPGRARGERSGLVTPTVLSVLAIGAGVMVALHAAGLVVLSIVGLAAGGLVIVGLGLVASLWLGRARGLVPLGLGLVAVLVGAASIGPWVDEVRAKPLVWNATIDGAPAEAMGELSFAPESLDALMPRYDLGMGKLTLDLSRLDFAGQTRAVEVNVGMGQLIVLLPPGVRADVSSDVGIGKVDVFGETRDGLGNSLQHVEDGAAGLLDLELDVGLGEAQVRRANP